ncbi:DUF2382 domain-containing protein [Pseudonocardia oceani]|uniref:DUF2382 domain-containing protein n=1 Tax=Pseudonocardia oceani TaxID=2792013 RepID=UPI001CF710DD|nr:PRC and DUF2382 domain-containing protein [Pseudonocardia oceani]
MITQDQLRDLVGSTAYDRDGDKLGKIGQVYYDDETTDPKWVTVNTGLFGTNENFVPVQGADASGDRVTVAYDKATIKDAPNIAEDGHLSVEEEEQLYRHYGLDYGGTGHRTGIGHGTDTDGTGTVGHDTSGPTTDNAMTRSEEQLRVGTESQEAGRARLRKHVVTEHQQVQVPVSHEEVRVEREPVTEANAGAAMDGPAISEEEHEVTLHAERPVVDKEAVPVERVKVGTETVRDTETVGGEVRKEEIEVDDAGTTGRRRD